MELIDFSKFSVKDSCQIQAPESLDKYLIDITKEYSPVDFLLSYNGVGCLSRGDLQAIKGKAKQGKSFACTSLETAVLSGDFMGFTATYEDTRVLHIDTEMNPLNVANKAKLIYSLCDWDISMNNDRLVLLSLRECSAEERIKVVERSLGMYKPDVVIIDGVRDLLHDFNDIAESGKLINDLMRLSSTCKCAIMCVLHENKSDGNMRGHLGTELLNKCSEAYQVTKKESTIVVEQTESRNAPIDKWSFCIDEEGKPQALEAPVKISKADAAEEKIRGYTRALFEENVRYSYTGLVSSYAERSGCVESTAKKYVSKAIGLGLISKQKDGFYVFCDFV